MKDPGISNKQKQYNDFGLGEKATSGHYRVLNKDGSFNIRKDNVPFFERINFYHALVSMSWPKFLTVVLSTYFCVNLFFAAIFMAIGIENLTGIRGTTFMEQLMEGFFFSAQTITTLGYGQVAPLGFLMNVAAATESMMGLLGFALVTGMVYSRFSKPIAKLKFSNIAVMAPYNDINALMFRVVNPHGNQLLEVETSVALSLLKVNSDLREFFPLELERAKVAFLPAVWTIVHPINQDSPFKDLSQDDLLRRNMEVIVVIKVFDETFSQTVFSRSSYKFEDLVYGEKFTYLISHHNGTASVDVSGINNTIKVDLNEWN